jgi:hypothetical protein
VKSPRHPDEDLPADFEARRHVHYAALRKPLDATAFIDDLRGEMQITLAVLDSAVPRLPWVTPLTRQAGPDHADRLRRRPGAAEPPPVKAELRARLGTVPLIDMLKDAVPRTGCLTGITAAAGHDARPGGPGERCPGETPLSRGETKNRFKRYVETKLPGSDKRCSPQVGPISDRVG